MDPFAILEPSRERKRGVDLPREAIIDVTKEERPIKDRSCVHEPDSLYPSHLVFRGRAMLADLLDQNEPALTLHGGQSSRARPGKGVEDDIIWFGIRFDERSKCENRLLIGVDFV